MKTPQNLTLFPLIRRIACSRFQEKKLRENHVGAGQRQTRRGGVGVGQVIRNTTNNLPVLLILDGVESEFREPHVRLTFREAVQLFEHRSQFIRRSSDSCLVSIFTYHSFFDVSFINELKKPKFCTNKTDPLRKQTRKRIVQMSGIAFQKVITGARFSLTPLSWTIASAWIDLCPGVAFSNCAWDEVPPSLQ